MGGTEQWKLEFRQAKVPGHTSLAVSKILLSLEEYYHLQPILTYISFSFSDDIKYLRLYRPSLILVVYFTNGLKNGYLDSALFLWQLIRHRSSDKIDRNLEFDIERLLKRFSSALILCSTTE